ncbi:MAG TPA: DNA repair protein RecN [Blastocatellia bacterium]|nr:DNA repair protein RecN [Blastocatellia bacterium]
MLKYLNISNLAVINQLQLELRRGLNILSGETGSGKSIVVDAVGLLLGEKSSAEMIRTGETRAFVEGIFSVEGNLPLLDLLAESGIVTDSEEVVIKREIQSGGRGRIFVNNQSATLSLLKAIQPHLIDIHGQGDQQSLLSPEAHLKLLDAFAGAEGIREEVESFYELLVDLAQALEESRKTESERLQLLDLLNYQVVEIECANIRVNEDVELEAERQVLANAERLVALCSEVYSLLYDDEHSILTQLGVVLRRLSEIVQVDAGFSSHLECLSATKYTLEDTAFFVRDYAGNINASPESLKSIEDRLVELDRLKHKYAGGLYEIIEKLSDLKLRRESLQNDEDRELELKAELRRSLKQYEMAAEKLSRLRKAGVRSFEKEALAEMAEVALDNSQFQVCLSRPSRSGLMEKLGGWMNESDIGVPTRYGREEVEFYFSANAGEDVRPIRAVASGGELSRLMLILKTITAPTQFPRTLIFDEIDSGISGRVAEAVGLRLKRLSETNQVLCVTHQAQIARYADAHFQVTKEVSGDRTTTRVLELLPSDRVEELARMIGGSEITAVVRKHARELLKSRG